jgi:hypothetical protein
MRGNGIYIKNYKALTAKAQEVKNERVMLNAARMEITTPEKNERRKKISVAHVHTRPKCQRAKE